MPIVEAVASMVAHGSSGAAGDLADKIQLAMSKAVSDAQAAGVTDQEEIRKAQLTARDYVLAKEKSR